ncbi:hypothetical protein WJ968_32885 [Achromobacter xylosoxidans]
MSTYFNIVNLDKKEQASLVICKTQDEVDATIKNWEEKSQRKWHREDRDPEFYERQNDGSWTKEAKRFYHSRQKMVMGFTFGLLVPINGDMYHIGLVIELWLFAIALIKRE